MKYVEAGGTRVSAIGLGCWQFGSRDWGYGRGYADETAIELVHTALDLGVNLIDTAEVYARGVSETIVGRALAERRNEAFVATKVLPVWPTADRVEEHGRLSALRLRRRADRPVPGALAESRRAPAVDHGGDASPAGHGSRAPRRCQQLLGEAVAARRTAVGRPGAVEPGAVLVAAPPGRRTQRAVRAGARPHRDRLQPTRAGRARRPLRQGSPAARAGAAQQPAVPPGEPRAGDSADRDPTAHRRRARRDAGASRPRRG